MTSAAPVFAQVTVDLHALRALPDHPAAVQPSHPPRPSPQVAARPAPASTATAPTGTSPTGTSPAGTAPTGTAPTGTAPGAPPAAGTPVAAVTPAQPVLPDNAPVTATIAPVVPQAPPPGAQPPNPPPVSETAATVASPTTAGLRLTFAPGESALSPPSNASVKELVATTPLADDTTFNVLAYAPGTADDPSTARRVSLSRAMAIRGALVAAGVPSARIFVRALGDRAGDGPSDRADISVTGANAPATSAAKQ